MPVHRRMDGEYVPCTHSGLYSATKNKMMLLAGKWMQTEIIVSGAINQAISCHVFSSFVGPSYTELQSSMSM